MIYFKYEDKEYAIRWHYLTGNQAGIEFEIAQSRLAARKEITKLQEEVVNFYVECRDERYPNTPEEAEKVLFTVCELSEVSMLEGDPKYRRAYSEIAVGIARRSAKDVNHVKRIARLVSFNRLLLELPIRLKAEVRKNVKL